ncbi:MAG: hypothetical protein ACLPV8_11690 [Steroidobacteraceae bacterium]
MHEVFENWSLPWQTLQRSLAEAFGAEAKLNARAGVNPPNAQRNVQRTASSSASWLVRARSSALQVYRAGQQP